MAKDFKDFIYLDKSLSELPGHYIAVDFEQDPDPYFAFARDIEYGETNRFRPEPNTVSAAFTDRLKLELHIVKDPGACQTPKDRILSPADIREVARWLTSSTKTQLLTFEYDHPPEGMPCFFYGQFSDIQSFHVNGDVYGLRLMFECSSPYGYTDSIVHAVTCTGDTKQYNITSCDDRLNEYCYPVIHINAAVTGQVYFLNLSDCQIHEQGTLQPAETPALLMRQLQDKISDYALIHGYAPQYQLTDDGQHIITIGEDTAVCFLFRDAWGKEHKCIACYVLSTLQYYIIQGGFLYFGINRDLPITIDAKRLFLFDDLKRMVTLDEIGITDTDYIYWPRLLAGDNNYLFWGRDCTFTITYQETRKAGA